MGLDYTKSIPFKLIEELRVKTGVFFVYFIVQSLQSLI